MAKKKETTICPSCNGSGEKPRTLAEKESKRCVTCGGSGQLLVDKNGITSIDHNAPIKWRPAPRAQITF
ncbi:MAG: hypothetical protein LBK50_03860 [Candidatus Nomurabacteria bacterium]|jgi:DnaJ-class molecular chaperone|nr:hypothetical protein [Candidatus Nomurabacteria bacterium]